MLTLLKRSLQACYYRRFTNKFRLVTLKVWCSLYNINGVWHPTNVCALAAIPECFGVGREYAKGLVFKDKILGREVDKGQEVMLFNEG